MIRLHRYQDRKYFFVFPAQLLCLLMAGVLEFFIMAEGHMYNKSLYNLLHMACRLACCGFCFVSLLQPRSRLFRTNLIPAFLMAGWFLFVEFLHRSNGLEDHAMGMFLSVYLLAFPFASVSQDHHKQTGLRTVSGLYIAASMMLLVFSVLLLTERIPDFLRAFLFWDGTRLHVIHHPNIVARILMIAIALVLGFLVRVDKPWAKGLLVLGAGILFACMALTNSRACILIACALFGGNVFFRIHNGSFLRFLAGAAAAVLVMALLFFASSNLFQWNTARLKEQVSRATAQEQSEEMPVQLQAEAQILPEAVPLAEAASGEDISHIVSDDFFTSNQHSLLSDLLTLNSRTRIWTAVFQRLQQEPWILLFGTDDTQVIGQNLKVDHTHNAWLETLLRLGIPGFLLSLYFTVQAIWSAICLLWSGAVDLWKKNIAMLSLCLLVTSMMEPLLFFTNEWAHFIDFFFFLSLGYLILWRKQLPAGK